MARGGGAKKIFQHCVNPNSSKQFLYIRATQGHSGDNVVDPALQDNVLLPKGFTEYLHHVGNANELISHKKKWINSRRNKPQERKTSGLLHYSEDDGGRIWHWRNSMQSDEAKDRAIQDYLETSSKYGILVHFEARPKEMSAILPQTRSHAVVLHNTLLAACIERAVCMKTQDELYQKVRLTPRVPRVALKSTSQYGLQDPQNPDARSSWEPSSDSKSYGEICDNIVDHRILGVPLSAVEQQNTARENKVKRLIEKFENHKNKESFIQDLRQTEKIKFSKESQELIADMNNTEIFELCENSYKQQCPDCNAYWRIGVIYCICGKYEIYAESYGVRPEQP